MRRPAMILALLVACGGKAKPADETETEATKRRGLPGPDNEPYPHGGMPADPCDQNKRVEVAMSCFDDGAKEGASCKSVGDALTAKLTAAAATQNCITSLGETCQLGCQSAANHTESRDHWYMLMTSPPP